MIHLVHGIRSRNPVRTMGALYSALAARGLPVNLIDYGYILVPLTNGRATRAIKKVASAGSVLVGYSNGGAAVHAVCAKVQPRHVVLISPALPVDVKWPAGVESITVFYSPGDDAVRAGGIWAWVANRMPWRWGSARDHVWGRMGLIGATNGDPRVKNIQMPSHVAHSWFLHLGIVDMISRRIEEVHARAPRQAG